MYAERTNNPLKREKQYKVPFLSLVTSLLKQRHFTWMVPTSRPFLHLKQQFWLCRKERSICGTILTGKGNQPAPCHCMHHQVQLWSPSSGIAVAKSRPRRTQTRQSIFITNTRQLALWEKKTTTTTAAYCEDHAKQFIATVMQVVYTAPTIPQRLLP